MSYSPQLGARNIIANSVKGNVEETQNRMSKQATIEGIACSTSRRTSSNLLVKLRPGCSAKQAGRRADH